MLGYPTTPYLSDGWTYVFKASGQYNSIQHVFTYFDQIIAEIPGPRKKDLTLPALQEITRNTVSMRGQNCSEEITDALLEASQLVQKVLETRFDDQIKPRNHRLDWIWRVSGQVPKLKNWDFTYGTLDCAIQLARAFGPSTVSLGLQQTIQRLVFESSDEYFRWKAVSTMRLVIPPAHKANLRRRLSSFYVITVTEKDLVSEVKQ